MEEEDLESADKAVTNGVFAFISVSFGSSILLTAFLKTGVGVKVDLFQILAIILFDEKTVSFTVRISVVLSGFVTFLEITLPEAS